MDDGTQLAWQAGSIFLFRHYIRGKEKTSDAKLGAAAHRQRIRRLICESYTSTSMSDV